MIGDAKVIAFPVGKKAEELALRAKLRKSLKQARSPRGGKHD